MKVLILPQTSKIFNFHVLEDIINRASIRETSTSVEICVNLEQESATCGTRAAPSNFQNSKFSRTGVGNLRQLI